MQNEENNPNIGLSRLHLLAHHIGSGCLNTEPQHGLIYSGQEWVSQKMFVHTNGIMIYFYRFPFCECGYEGKFGVVKKYFPWYLLFMPWVAGFASAHGASWYIIRCPNCLSTYKTD